MKLLIVDDDENTVRMIKHELEWESIGIDRVLSAEDGERAVAVISNEHPDIILCDIEMPIMNGMDVIKWMAERQIAAEVIILSCHDRFEYARAAMRCGVREYLLKPFRKEELAAVVAQAVLQISRRQNDKKPELPKLGRIYWEQGFLWSLLNGTVPKGGKILQDMIEEEGSALRMDEAYRLIYVGVNTRDLELCGYTEAEFYFIIQNIATEVICGAPEEAHVLKYKKEPYYFLAFLVAAGEADGRMLRRRGENLLQVSDRYLKIPVHCVIGHEMALTSLASHGHEMENFFLEKAPCGKGSLVFAGEAAREVLAAGAGLDEQKLLGCLRERRQSEFTRYVRNYLVESGQAGLLDLPFMKRVRQIIFAVISQYGSEYRVSCAALFTDAAAIRLQSEAPYSISNMLRYTAYMLTEMQEKIREFQQNMTSVEKAKEYIEAHYSENIGRDEIAAFCHLSRGYLSTLFQESTGMNLREYINLQRIEHAKRLMGDPDKSIGFIAMEVGFDSLPYFSTVFKKRCGETPAEWRKRTFL